MSAPSDDGPRGLGYRMHTEIVGFRRRVIKIVPFLYLYAGTALLCNISGRRIAFSSRFLAILRHDKLCRTIQVIAR